MKIGDKVKRRPSKYYPIWSNHCEAKKINMDKVFTVTSIEDGKIGIDHSDLCWLQYKFAIVDNVFNQLKFRLIS